MPTEKPPRQSRDRREQYHHKQRLSSPPPAKTSTGFAPHDSEGAPAPCAVEDQRMTTAHAAAALQVQRMLRGHIGRRKYMDALWESMQAEEEERERRQRDDLAAGLALLDRVAEERQAFDKQVLARSAHFAAQKGDMALAAIKLQRRFRRHKRFVEMCDWAKPGSKIRQARKSREARAISLCVKLRSMLESEFDGAYSDNGERAYRGESLQLAKSDSYHAFEGMCRTVSRDSTRWAPQTPEHPMGRAFDKHANASPPPASTDDVLDFPSFIEVFERLGLHLPADEVENLHRHFSGHYPSLTRFLREGNVDRVEAELFLLVREFKSKEGTLDDVFSFFDKNGDGHISLFEFRSALDELHFDARLHEREIDTLLKRFKVRDDDTDADDEAGGTTRAVNAAPSKDSGQVRIDYSDFLDHFGDYDDFLRSQAICADVVIFMESLVARQVHHREHGRVDVSHARSVHSPDHLASIMSNNRRPNSPPRFGEQGYDMNVLRGESMKKAAALTPRLEDKWWTSSSDEQQSSSDEQQSSGGSESGSDGDDAFMMMNTVAEVGKKREENKEDEQEGEDSERKNISTLAGSTKLLRENSREGKEEQEDKKAYRDDGSYAGKLARMDEGEEDNDGPSGIFFQGKSNRRPHHDEWRPTAASTVSTSPRASNKQRLAADGSPAPPALTPRTVASLEQSLLAKLGAEMQRELSRSVAKSVAAVSPEALDRAVSEQMRAVSQQLRQEVSQRMDEEEQARSRRREEDRSTRRDEEEERSTRGRHRQGGSAGYKSVEAIQAARVGRHPPGPDQPLSPSGLRALLAEEKAALLSDVRSELLTRQQEAQEALLSQQRAAQDALLSRQRAARGEEERANSKRAEKQARLERGLVTLQQQLTKLEHEQKALERDQRSTTHAMDEANSASAAVLSEMTHDQREAMEASVRARVDETTARQTALLERRAREERQRGDRLEKSLADLQRQIRALENERNVNRRESGRMAEAVQSPEPALSSPPGTPQTGRMPRTPLADVPRADVIEDVIEEDIPGQGTASTMSVLSGDCSTMSATAPDFMTHESHALLISSTREKTMKSVTKKASATGKAKTKGQARSREPKQHAIPLTTISSPTSTMRLDMQNTSKSNLLPDHPRVHRLKPMSKYSVVERVVQGSQTPPPSRRQMARSQSARAQLRPSSAPRMRRRQKKNVRSKQPNAFLASRNSSGTTKRSKNKANARRRTREEFLQLAHIRQRLMKTIVANRLFSQEDLDFVFENAILLSPFEDKTAMRQMVEELKIELGLPFDMPTKMTKHSIPSRYSVQTTIPGSKSYHHDLPSF